MEFFEQTLLTASKDYNSFKTLGNRAKAQLWGDELMQATLGAWESPEDIYKESTDPELGPQIWNTYYILHSQKDSGFWKSYQKRFNEDIRSGMPRD